MKKSKFIKSSIILIIGGLITKVLGMIIKIIITRLIGTEGIGIYMMISPTYMLLISICTFGFPIAISKLVAEDKFNNKNIILSIMPISLIINLIIMILLFLFGNFISNTLLHEPRTYYAIIVMGFVLPFISISSIIRGYFFGKERMIPHVISNICEDIIRLVVLIIGIPIFLTQGIEYAVAFIVVSNIFSELSSIIILTLCLPKKNIKLNDFIPKKKNIKSVFDISIPTTIGRLIGNIGYFLEPIILTTVLLSMGYSNKYIVYEYGIVSGFVLPTLLLPSFFTGAISQALIPVISKSYSNNNLKYTKNKIKQAIFICLLIGIPVTIFFLLLPEFCLDFLYNTTEGVSYLRFLAPICLMQYIQSPLTSSLQAMGKAKQAMHGTLIGMISRTILLFILSSLKIGMWGLVISTSISIFLVTYHQYKEIKKVLK
ncbi:MAG: hypothetical protein E7157_06000 [Lactobacillales bacterium]|nr:hypothetical protein [Lactobacillales bacterium]